MSMDQDTPTNQSMSTNQSTLTNLGMSTNQNTRGHNTYKSQLPPMLVKNPKQTTV